MALDRLLPSRKERTMQPNQRKKMRRSILLTILAVVAGIGSACDSGTSNKPVASTPAATPAAASSPAASPAVSPAVSPAANDARKTADALVGKWTGPEGTYLNVTKNGDKFKVEIKDLDSAKTYDGTAKNDVIEFVRNGKTETVKTATGAETGMKGFEKETNCVVVTKGSEGFCRKADMK
jgi:hypothetical protein